MRKLTDLLSSSDPAATGGSDQPVWLPEALRVLRHLIVVPPVWAIIVILAALLSAFEVVWKEGETIQVAVRVTGFTAAILGLVWLPSLLRTWALVGGNLKTSVGEASSPGILESLIPRLQPDAALATTAAVAAAAEQAETEASPAERPELRRIVATLDATVDAPVMDRSAAVQRVKTLAAQYDALRENVPSGRDRTRLMTQIVFEARALARAGLDPPTAVATFRPASNGERVTGLALVQGAPTPDAFDVVRDAIAHSRSAFEQYTALVTMESLIGLVSAEERAPLRAVLEDQMRGGPGRFITPDTDRWPLAQRLLHQVTGR